MKERDYSTLLTGMRKAPTITDAEEVIRTQGKIKLPDRRSITLWDSPELAQFRGVNEDSEKAEEKRHVARVEHLEAKRRRAHRKRPCLMCNSYSRRPRRPSNKRQLCHST